MGPIARANATPGGEMRALLDVVLLVLELYWWVIILAAIFSWLYAFNVVNPSNQFVGAVGRILYQLTEPALRPIRRYVPPFGGLDITPIILLLIIFLIRRVIILYLYPNVF
jgi:YggT family protein